VAAYPVGSTVQGVCVAIPWDLAGIGSPPVEREVDIAGRTGNLTVVGTGARADPMTVDAVNS